MDRKGILGLILVVVLFGAWEFYYFRKEGEHREAMQRHEAEVAALEAANPKPAPDATTETPAPATPNALAAPVAEAAAPEKTERLATKLVDYEFTSAGGGIRRATLLDHYSVGENRVVLNQYGTIPIGAVSEVPGEGTSRPFTSSVESGAIVFDRIDERQIQLTKRYTLPKFTEEKGAERLRDEYLVKLDLSFTNRGDQPVEMPLYYVHTGSAAPIHQSDLAIYTGYNFFRGTSNTLIDVSWFAPGGMLFFKRDARPVYPEKPEVISDLRWAGVTNQYFTTLFTPLVDGKAMSDEQTKQRGVALWAKGFFVSDEAWRAAGHPPADVGERAGVEGAIGMAGFKLQPGETVTRQFQIFGGPREYRRLDKLGNYEAEIMDFGIFGIVSKTLLVSMNWFSGVFGNYAWAIIVLTIIIKLLMWPLQNKATASMKRMQALQPKMTELREKHKDDPQKMNAEVMGLYKQYGVNPFGGCLPMLIQIPIFFGFYNMLGKAVELRNSEFLWVRDLSQPDTIFYLAGFPINILPIFMAITMLWSMQLQPKSGDPMQQRIFMFMPLIFMIFCYNYVSALALYFTVQNLFSIVQLYLTRNQTAPTLEKLTPAKAKR